jgi:hypothetical protein
MTDEHIEAQKPKSRVALDSKSAATLESWRKRLTLEYPGIRVTDSDLVNWMLSNAAVLSESQLLEIKGLYFDEVKQLQWMLAQAKKAKQEKESMT